MSDEITSGGSNVHRYENHIPKGFEPAIGDGDNIDAISNHIEKHVGKIESVFHEIVSDKVHIDVHWVKPTEHRPYHTLVTSGMSDKPMNVPEEADNLQYAELCVLLPSSWKINAESYALMEEVFSDENNYWPVRWLKSIARFPHEYDTWIGPYHTIPNGEKAEPFSENTKLGCMFVFPSNNLPSEFTQLEISENKVINFYSLYPTYKEEMNYKLNKGSDALLDKFREFRVSSVIDVNRINTCARKKFLGLW
ncbi:suppressor of fused domain protein [Pedobacter panaciterrae]|uniref:suppressor of fused domain protein n=1 Tax=Pedobacter panaciterrae TaxID=363849 RepID=UPI0025964FFE|nr:suppressor of fused domain protein [uncultured Pedobacter sp.]